MKIIIVAGPPSVGKTSVIKHIVANYHSLSPVIVKIDVVKAFEDKEFSVPIKIVYSGSLCPDHAGILVLSDAIEWAEGLKSSLLIVESAGLCLRCTPYINQGLGIVVLSSTDGSNAPLKMSIMIATADVAVITKGDLVSQAEKEVFRECVKSVAKTIDIVETNAVQGSGLRFLYKLIDDTPSYDPSQGTFLRGNPPLGVCTICVGKKEIGWKNHFGVVRELDKPLRFRGE